MIETKHQSLNQMKPIIKNDGIIVASNYFNRGKPQLLNCHEKYKQNKNMRRVLSGRHIGKIPKLKDNVIIQDEHLDMY